MHLFISNYPFVALRYYNQFSQVEAGARPRLDNMLRNGAYSFEVPEAQQQDDVQKCSHQSLK